ncbi:MAG: tripartite tricarboxylate transporter substrate binding protein [Phascolarctobacterium sp.]|nr:tripartite tricarboxylate transporter substrate binding protein [Phascolarctobacterium sp.]
MKKLLVCIMAMLTMAALVVGCGGSGKKAAYPADGDITVIIPKAPGGGTDGSARGTINFLQKELAGSKFTPVNKPDGGGVTGMVELANAKPDGHTLGMVTVELAMFPHQGKCKNTFADYKAICAPIAAPAALIVPKEAPYNTVDEFVKYAKANPGKVQMGNSGVGAIWHIAALSFEEKFGVQFKHVPYPKGTADIAAALAGKHIDATLADPGVFKGQVEAGKLKILAVMAARRSEIFPNVPTFKELGHDMTIRAWAVLAAPKDTPKEKLDVLRAAAKKACETKEFKEYFKKQGIDPTGIVGEEADKMMKEDHEMFGKFLKMAK